MSIDGRKRSTLSRSDSVNQYNGDSYADADDYVDRIGDEELLPDILSQKPGDDVGLETVVMIDGLPIVGTEKLDRFKGVLRKLLAPICKPEEIINEHFPMDSESGMTRGFAFYEFQNAEIVQNAIRTLNGHAIDKQHRLIVDSFTDYEKYANVPDEWEEPQPRPFKDVGNLRYWLESDECYDHYLIMCSGNGESVESAAVYENTPVEATLIESRHHWTENFAIWSPLGTYLATFHQKGVALWGGREFKQLVRFSHNNVIRASFSPKERYIMTMRNKPEYIPVDDQSMMLWDIITGAKKRVFVWDAKDPLPPAATLRWSYDEEFYALMGKESINVYETTTFGLLDRKPIKMPFLQDFTWSPSQNYIAYWVAETVDVPARIGLLEIPQPKDGRELRSKQIFGVLGCQFVWQKNGEYLCAKVDRYKHKSKAKDSNVTQYSGLSHNLEIFTLTSKKEIPVESLEIKDTIIDLAWEPNGNKLVLLSSSEGVTYASFFSGRLGKQFECIKKIPLRRKVERISWSPQGQFVVLHHVNKPINGYLIFVDTQDLTILSEIEHYLLGEVQWDPTGRYVVATSVATGPGMKQDNGYALYTFQGRFIQSAKVSGLAAFAWRPRPQTLLSADKQKEIRKNLKKYTPIFEQHDKMLLTKASKEVTERRKRQLDVFMQFVEHKRHYYDVSRQRRIGLRGGVDTDQMDEDPEELVEERVEVIMNYRTIPLD